MGTAQGTATGSRNAARFLFTLVATLSLIAASAAGITGQTANAQAPQNFYFAGFLALSDDTEIVLGDPEDEGTWSQGSINLAIDGYQWLDPESSDGTFHLSCSATLNGTEVLRESDDETLTIVDFAIYRDNVQNASEPLTFRCGTETFEETFDVIPSKTWDFGDGDIPAEGHADVTIESLGEVSKTWRFDTSGDFVIGNGFDGQPLTLAVGDEVEEVTEVYDVEGWTCEGTEGDHSTVNDLTTVPITNTCEEDEDPTPTNGTPTTSVDVEFVKVWFDADGDKTDGPTSGWAVTITEHADDDILRATLQGTTTSAERSFVEGRDYTVAEDDLPAGWDEVGCGDVTLTSVDSDDIVATGTGTESADADGVHVVCNQAEVEVLAEVLEEEVEVLEELEELPRTGLPTILLTLIGLLSVALGGGLLGRSRS